MKYTYEIKPYTLHFKNPAGTSRGVYHIHQVWYVILKDKNNPSLYGVGECAPLPDLSCDALPEEEYVATLQRLCDQVSKSGEIDYKAWADYPSMVFGLEVALRQLKTHSISLWDTPFSRGQKGIRINGLIWMGDYASMSEQIQSKLDQGYRCVKLKIGAIDFEKELELLKYIRTHFSADVLTLRVDANGAFDLDTVHEKLNQLAAFDIHSIEQPIRAGQWDAMAQLTKTSPIPIALDEELIGINQLEKKQQLLSTIKPQYIILKPTLHGGLKGAGEWIALAHARGIAWWATSALESNVGLNAIAQWSATFNPQMPQGLGTGLLYTNNIDMPLTIVKDELFYTSSTSSSDDVLSRIESL